MQPNLAATPGSIDLSMSHTESDLNGNGVASNNRKRKRSSSLEVPNGANGITNKENKKQKNLAQDGPNNNSLIVINLDDVNAWNESVLFNPIESRISTPPLINDGNWKKRRSSVITNGFSNDGAEASSDGIEPYHCSNDNPSHADLSSPSDLEIVHDQLNYQLASALISTGVDFDFITNPHFQKFISQLVTFSHSNQGYRLPSVDELSISYLNASRK